MLSDAKRRAKRKNREFSLTLDDLSLPDFCPILNVKIAPDNVSGGSDFSPTLDRKDNSKGYTKENTWIISQLANQMKSSASPDQLKEFAKWILKTYE